MVPHDKHNRRWTTQNGNIMLQYIRQGIIDKLKARDKSYGWIEGVDGLDQQPGVMEKVHDGRELKKLLKDAWDSYCSEARDPREELGAIGVDCFDYSDPAATQADLSNAIDRMAATIADAVAGKKPSKKK